MHFCNSYILGLLGLVEYHRSDTVSLVGAAFSWHGNICVFPFGSQLLLGGRLLLLLCHSPSYQERRPQRTESPDVGARKPSWMSTHQTSRWYERPQERTAPTEPRQPGQARIDEGCTITSLLQNSVSLAVWICGERYTCRRGI